MSARPLTRPRCRRCGGRVVIVLSGTTLSARCQKCNRDTPPRARPPEGGR